MNKKVVILKNPLQDDMWFLSSLKKLVKSQKNPLQVICDLQRGFQHDHSVIWLFLFAKLFNHGGLTTIDIWFLWLCINRTKNTITTNLSILVSILWLESAKAICTKLQCGCMWIRFGFSEKETLMFPQIFLSPEKLEQFCKTLIPGW
jgi:hypothetical protein